MNLTDYFSFKDMRLSRIADAEINETVELINPAYDYQEKVKGSPRTNAGHLRQRVNETDFYVVKADRKIVGCVYTEPKHESLHFGLLTLDKASRKTGLAQAIMDAIEAYARVNHFKSLGLHYMSLAPWLENYYKRRGYTTTGEMLNWGSIDLIHMSKKLDQLEF